MSRHKLLLLLAFGWTLPAGAYAQPAGSLVSVSVEVEGHETPLYCATDGSGRYYLEARPGARYAVHLSNRTSERLGVAVTVDGLNVISGEQTGPSRRISRWMTDVRPESDPGRMYILDPWDVTVIRGWRTSLQDVRRFTFVDERASYAARSGKANGKMGWIEVAAYRERRPMVRRRPDWRYQEPEADAQAKDESGRRQPPAAAPAPGPVPTEESDTGAEVGAAHDQKRARGLEQAERRDSYPGTGWGPRADDPAVVVQFDPQPVAAERVTLRYEYARALQALGLLPPRPRGRDRLAERDRGAEGFARPPEW